MVFNFLGLVSCLYKMVSFDKHQRRIEVFNDEKYPVTSKVFTAWDWSNNTYSMIHDYPASVLSDIQFEIKRSELLLIISKRPFNERMKLYFRRFISLILNLFLIFGGLYLIIKVNEK